MANEAIEIFFRGVIKDMAAQSPKVPVSSFRTQSDNMGGQLYSPDWFQYMIYGRGPGKRPPFKEPDNVIVKWLGRNPVVVTRFKDRFKYINEKGIAYLIGKNIGEKGTLIWQGKAKGIDLLGAIDNNLPVLLKAIGEQESIKFKDALSKPIK